MSRFQKIVLALLAAFWLPAAFPGTEEAEARVWLTRMATALHEQNYEGVFTYVRGGQFNSMQIVHKFEDGKEVERLLQLNGEKLEIMRIDDELVCYHEKSDHVDLEHHVPMGPFSSAFSENLETYQHQYRFSLHGDDRIAGRPAIKLGISPRFNDRYGYRLWLDRETGLLLQSHWLDVDRKRVLEIFQFSTVKIGDDFDETTLASSLSGDSISHRLTGEVASVVKENAVKPRWRVAWLPNGFRSVRVADSNRRHFTDGLATFSVFIERSAKSSLPEMATHVGVTVVISRRVKGINGQITVVGEVPLATARKVAESVEPVIY
ncbi:MAG: MucB/RseB C-terminal domain-containing protein [Gammaproteobacteria bacterium]|nr:MucB/RseB C-terminal domain-containing protein [Gammaproteobacteria bacterium]